MSRTLLLLLSSGLLRLATGATGQPGLPIAHIRITSSIAGAPVRVIARPDPWLVVFDGGPATRRGDTLLVRMPVRLQASLARHDVLVETADGRDLIVEGDVTGAGRRRMGAAGRAVVFKAGGRAIEVPGTLHPGIQELGGDMPPPRARFAPDPALSRAFPRTAGAWVSLSRPDTMIGLSVPCPTRGVHRAARRVEVPGPGEVQAVLTIGPGAHHHGAGYGPAYPRSSATHDEAAIVGVVHVTGGCAVGDTLTVTVDSLVFPSRRLAVPAPLSLPILLPAP